MSLCKVLLLKPEIIVYQAKEANLEGNVLGLPSCVLVYSVKDHWSKQPGS